MLLEQDVEAFAETMAAGRRLAAQARADTALAQPYVEWKEMTEEGRNGWRVIARTFVTDPRWVIKHAAQPQGKVGEKPDQGLPEPPARPGHELPEPRPKPDNELPEPRPRPTPTPHNQPKKK